MAGALGIGLMVPFEPILLDVCDNNTIEQAIATVQQQAGRIDVLVNIVIRKKTF